jgi:surface polysaccharide O-acyltransferase-like enzyme
VTVIDVSLRPAQVSPRAMRQAWIDNLRVTVIAGVILMHVASAYVLDIDWYYEERTTSAATEIGVAATILPAALFAMGILFLVAGLLTQRSLAAKGARVFLRARLLRLAVPLVLYTLLIGPLTSVIGARAEGDPAADDIGSLFIAEVRQLDTGPLWFVAALLTFSLAYTAWRQFRPAPPLPGSLRPSHLIAAGTVIVIGSFFVRLVWPLTSDSPFNLNLWEWPQMAMLFALGTMAGARGWLEPVPAWIRRTCARAAIVGLTGLLTLVGAVSLTGDPDAFTGGWNLQAIAAPAVEATIAIAMSLWTFAWFARHGNHDGPLARSLGRASFAAYIFHAPVIVLLSAALSSIAIVAELKFIAVAASGVATSFTLGWLATRARPLTAVL